MDTPKAVFSSVSRYGRHFFKLLRDTITHIVAYCRVLPGLCYRIVSNTIGSSSDSFHKYFESRHGTSHPKFFEGTFQLAQLSAFRNGKLLAVCLHSDSRDELCASVLTNSLVIDILDSNFVFYVEHGKGPRMRNLIQRLDARRLPHMSVMVMRSYREYAVIASTSDFSTASNVVSMLVGAIENPVSSAGARSDDLSIHRQIVTEQDAELQKAIEADVARMRSKDLRENNDLRRRQLRADNRLKRQQLISDRKEFARKYAATSHTGNTKIKVRLPSGRTIESVFNKDDTVGMLYDWVGAAEYLCDNQVKIPYAFDLSIPHPSTTLGDRAQTLEKANLYPNASLVLISRDDSDEDDV
ncbi:-FAS-associated factor 2 [Babesia bigemina]|uniref:-FAS-associated factor 2 n=1 Tax=Babesia bigemina TaxID=5866 RepID=A0A061DBA7_BABBI|nr:-FAS-associated factor 2 [Babesia bigemina]CDR97798.1 -FAS-associated factor 2 [Babesia bigemina]|eukprot:XP_012769984.1 -FAS-associated factor 2 [Babesia bigemina]